MSLILFLLRNTITGISFLFIFLSLICLLLALFGFLYLPWKNSLILRAFCILRWLYFGCAAVFIISFTIAQILIWQTAKHANSLEPDASCLVVLGAGLFNGEIPSYVLQNRLVAAYNYLQTHPQSVAILSGGQGKNENISEAYAMQRWLISRGINKERLYMEDLSTSTYENIAFSLPIIQELGYETAVIVTNDFHLLRASQISTYYGLKTQLLGAPTPKIFLVPVTYYIREYFALVKAWFMINLFTNRMIEVA